MANLTVKDISDDLYKKLKRRARANRRSIAGETTLILERALGEQPYTEDELFERARSLRERTGIYLTEAERRKAVEQGRA